MSLPFPPGPPRPFRSQRASMLLRRRCDDAGIILCLRLAMKLFPPRGLDPWGILHILGFGSGVT